MYRRQRVSWADAPLWRKIVTVILVGLSFALFTFLGARWILNNMFTGTQVCTVDSAKFNSSNGGEPGAVCLPFYPCGK